MVGEYGKSHQRLPNIYFLRGEDDPPPRPKVDDISKIPAYSGNGSLMLERFGGDTGSIKNGIIPITGIEDKSAQSGRKYIKFTNIKQIRASNEKFPAIFQ